MVSPLVGQASLSKQIIQKKIDQKKSARPSVPSCHHTLRVWRREASQPRRSQLPRPQQQTACTRDGDTRLAHHSISSAPIKVAADSQWPAVLPFLDRLHRTPVSMLLLLLLLLHGYCCTILQLFGFPLQDRPQPIGDGTALALSASGLIQHVGDDIILISVSGCCSRPCVALCRG